jgi:hypothetical protein
MAHRQGSTDSAPLFIAATAAYALNCALGTAVATRVIDTSGFRWLHHALYIATCATTAAALSSAWWGRPKFETRRAALALSPAGIPLASIPYLGSRGRRHPLVALSAAPFVIAGLVCAILPADRK